MAVAIVVALVAGAGHADAEMRPMAGMQAPPAAQRRPDVDLLRAFVAAGGGAAHFTTTDLVGTLAGGDPGPELGKLTRRFGVADVKRFVRVFDSVVDDALGRLARAGIVVSAQPPADAIDGDALAARLRDAGTAHAGAPFDVERLLDRLLSAPVHARTMNDVVSRFGPTADPLYHRVLARLIVDLAPARSVSASAPSPPAK